MVRSVAARRERTLELAHNFVLEVRRDLERAAAAGADLPPRIRSVHERVGHATPEYRTFAVPLPNGAAGASPQALSEVIARFASTRPPICLMLALDALTEQEDGLRRSVLIAEARDRDGTRLFLLQPFQVENGRIRWEDPAEGGWRDPGEEEMILDASFGL